MYINAHNFFLMNSYMKGEIVKKTR